MSLKKETLSGLLWTFLDVFVLKGAGFIASLILARILGPKEFGLMGMIAIFIAIGTTLVDSGLSSSLIRTKETDDEDFSTVFYANLSVSVFIYILFYLLAPFISDFYHQEILTSLIRLYCLSFVLSAFSSVQISLLIKTMKFKKLMIYNLPGTIIGIAVGLIMGYLGYGVWSIVWMYLTTQIVQSIILWIASSWKPTLVFSYPKLRFHFNFGYKLLLSGLIDRVFQNIYNVIIGKNYSVQTLGYYERASMFNQYPVTVLTGVINKVTFPLISNIQEQKEKVEFIYKKILQLTFFISCPLMFGAAAIAKPLVLLTLGTEWLPVVPFFQIISLASMFYPIHAFNINILKVYGRSDLFLKLEIMKKVVISLGIIVGYFFGIYGLVWSSVVTSFLALIINTHYSRRLINYNTKKQLWDMLPIFVISLFMCIMMNTSLYFLNSLSYFTQVLISGLVGLLCYFGINVIFNTRPVVYLKTIIKFKKI